MKILVTGAGGMLGSDLCEFFHKSHAVLGVGRTIPKRKLSYRFERCDLTQQQETQQIISDFKPELLFHAAAMTNVDQCQLEPQLANLHNTEATKNVVLAANQTESFIIFFSTDYIFDGTKKTAYLETDIPSPSIPYEKRNHYGESKRNAEIYIQQQAQNFIIFRVAWLYGMQGKSFPRTIIQLTKKQTELRIVKDQKGSPTYTRDIAAAFSDLIRSDPKAFHKSNKEIFNMTNSGVASWADVAREILNLIHNQKIQVVEISSKELNRPAPRPMNSVLSAEKLKNRFNISLRDWKPALKEFIIELNKMEP